MQTQKYSVNQHLIETLLVCVKSGEIAIPEIQRLRNFNLFYLQEKREITSYIQTDMLNLKK